MILFLIFFMIIIYFFVFIFSNHIHIIWRTFLRKGFAKIDNQFGLICYTGKQGEGKTYSCIKYITEQKLENDYKIITNVHSYNVFADTIFIDNIEEIIDFINGLPQEEQRKYIIFFDEIFTILEKQTRINKKILSFISQLRKRQIIFVTTAQEWSEINITFRRYVRFQVSCHMFSAPFFRTAFLTNRINDGDQIRWDNDVQDFIAPTIRTNFMKGNLIVIQSYDTFETIKTS